MRCQNCRLDHCSLALAITDIDAPQITTTSVCALCRAEVLDALGRRKPTHAPPALT